ncbi:MAG: tripartite tricarboxylate transporter substrate binding protein [Syntrophales bacterium LBB04]|nr:tripartite tricarboxylate transporter substrate binding protein [Syntrophales bacterium LBB04]
MKVHRPIKGESLIVLFLLIAAVMAGFGEARGEYPERPITMILPTGPGGPLDLIDRAIANGAQKQLGQPLVLENRPGGGGTVGLAMVAAAKPDGYTLCGASSTPMIRAPLLQKVPFKPLGSFTPIIGFALPHSALVVRSDAPWKTFKEFLDYSKKNPGRVKYSTSGFGSAMHHAMEVVARSDDIKWVHVPYQGTAPALAALLGGHVDACSSGADFLVHARAGSVRILATNGEKRLPGFPGVPTLKELGYNFVDETVFSVVGPAGLSPQVITTLENAFGKGAETAEFKATLNNLDHVPVHYGSKSYAEYLKALWFNLEKSLKETGLMKEPATPPY